MITPVHLLKLFTNRETFELYYKFINQDILPNDVVLILKDYKEYYARFANSECIDFEQFVSLFQTDWHAKGMSVEKHNAFQLLFDNIKNIEYKEVEECLPAFFAAETKDKITKVWDQKFDANAIRLLLDEYDTKLSTIRQEFDPDILLPENIDWESMDRTYGLTWCLNGLQQNLGSMISGSYIVLVAPVNIGKSGMCFTQAVHSYLELVKKKSSQPILYINTEGDLKKVWARFFTALFKNKLGYTTAEIITHKDEVLKEYAKLPQLFLPLDGMGRPWQWLEAKIKKFNPALVLVDMVNDLQLKDKAPDTLAYEKLHGRLRYLSGKYCPIIGTVQSKNDKYWDSESHSKKTRKWLDIDDINWSNISIQGKAETIITVGRDDNFPNDRYINIVKLKEGTGGHLPAVCYNYKYATYQDYGQEIE